MRYIPTDRTAVGMEIDNERKGTKLFDVFTCDVDGMLSPLVYCPTGISVSWAWN